MAVITKGRQIQDRDSIGGIKAVFVVIDASENANEAVLFDSGNTTRSGNQITDFEDGTYEALQFDVLRGSGGFTQSVEGSIENGTYSFNMSLEFTLHKIDEATQDAIEALAKTRATLFVLDNNDNVLCAGLGNGMEMVGGSFQTGAGYGELNGSTLTFEGREITPAPFLIPTAGAGTTNYPFDNVPSGATPTVLYTASA